jgi:CRP-like cAMP-binding protein
MLAQTDELDDFKRRLSDSLQYKSLNFTTIRIAKHSYAYVCGDAADSVYFIESGQLKLLMLSPEA